MRLIRNKPAPADFGLRISAFGPSAFGLRIPCQCRPLATAGSSGLHRFAVLTAMATLGLVGIGGLVTSHGAGMAVPDWPNTYGYNMFFFPVSQWVGGIFYEHTHRLVASGVGLLTVVLALWLYGRSARPVMRWGGLILLAARESATGGGSPADGRMALVLGLGGSGVALAQAGFGRAASRARNGCAGAGLPRSLPSSCKGCSEVCGWSCSRTPSASFTPRWRSFSSC